MAVLPTGAIRATIALFSTVCFNLCNLQIASLYADVTPCTVLEMTVLCQLKHCYLSFSECTCVVIFWWLVYPAALGLISHRVPDNMQNRSAKLVTNLCKKTLMQVEAHKWNVQKTPGLYSDRFCMLHLCTYLLFVLAVIFMTVCPSNTALAGMTSKSGHTVHDGIFKPQPVDVYPCLPSLIQSR